MANLSIKMEGFKNILVPVDLTMNTEVAVKKALELAGSETVVHLLYVLSYSGNGLFNLHHHVSRIDKQPGEKSIAEKLAEWKCMIEESVNGIKVCVWISMKERIQKEIERKARQLNANLVIIGKNSHHSWLPFLNTVVPSEIAKSTRIPVLTVKPGSLYSKLRTIIVPIASGRPEPKLEAISAICEKFRVKIYLVSFMNNHVPVDFYSSALLSIYRRIRAFSDCPVEYAVLNGKNKARAILDYANEMNADMLLVHPDLETKIGWPSKYISDVLPASSKVQVLAV
jgi:nucleotide-binding universal stress UspA family protein